MNLTIFSSGDEEKKNTLRQVKEAAKKFHFLVDSPLRGGGGGCKGLFTKEKRTFSNVFLYFFLFVSVLLTT